MNRRIRNRIMAAILAAVVIVGNSGSAVTSFAADAVPVEQSAEENVSGLEDAEAPEEEDAGDPEEVEAPEEEDAGDPEEAEAPEEDAGDPEDAETPEEENAGDPEEAEAPEEEDANNPEDAGESEGENTGDLEESEKENTNASGEMIEQPDEEVPDISENILNEIIESETLEETRFFEENEEEALCICGSEEEDALLHAWDCPIFQEAFLELCDCGEESPNLTEHEYECAAVLKAFAAICDDECGAYEHQAAAHRCEVQSRLLKALCTCDSDSDDFSEHDEECEYYKYLLGSINILYGASLTANYTPDQSGTRLSASSVKDWTLASGNFSSKYFGVRFIEGISSMSTWVDSGADVTESSTSRYLGLHPNDSESTTKGHFGALYSKVIYDGEKWYDMKVTVVNYTNSVTSLEGTKVTVRPGIRFCKDSIEYLTSQEVGGLRLRIDFLESGTDTNAKLNIRFQWLDIDDSQRYGFSVKNSSGTSYGTVDKKYYFSEDTTVNVLNTTVLGGEMEVLIGDFNNIQERTDERTRIAYELSDCSRYYMTIGPVDNMGDSDLQRVYTAETYKNWEKAMKAGEYSFDTDLFGDGNVREQVCMEDIIAITDVTALIDTPSPIKAVSNDGGIWGTTNTLSLTTGEYYYRIAQRIPWQDEDYRYRSFKITDSLPSGVDYVSLAGIKDEGGRDKSSLFTVDASGDVLTVNAKNPTDSGFAGHYYYFVFKVKMDPTEVTPTYSGNTASYSVKNKASVSYVHVDENENSGTKNTNEVTTTATTTRPTPADPQKGINGDSSLTTYTASSRTEDIVFSIFQKVPAYETAWEPCTVTVTDTLEKCLEYKGYSVKLNGSTLSSGWSVSASGQTITISGTNQRSYSGGTLRFDITCRLKSGYDLSAYRNVENGSVIATIPNTAKVKFVYSHASSTTVEKNTNTVHVKIRENAANLIIRKTDADTGETIPNAGFTVYEWNGISYGINRGAMSYDASSQTYRMNLLVRTSSNSGKFKVVETSMPKGYTGVWEKEFTIEDSTSGKMNNLTYAAANTTPRGIINIHKINEIGSSLEGGIFEISAKKDIVSPQGKVLVKAGTVVDTVTTGKDGKASTKELYLGTYAIKETSAPMGYVIDPTVKEVTLTYKDKNTTKIEAQLTFTDSLAVVPIQITKEIDTADIVWAHGNPTFTFKVEGKDLYERSHTYYETVEFTKDKIGNGEKTVLTVKVNVYSGTYTATEENTMRYELKKIHDVVNGTVNGKTVTFNLSKGVSGLAVFYNEKTTDESQSHTAFVRNVIQK